MSSGRLAAGSGGLGLAMVKRILTKVFQGLWSKGTRPGDVAAELGVTAEEMGKMLFGMTFMSGQRGDERSVGRESERTLSLVR